jgi:hypothetical protein
MLISSGVVQRAWLTYMDHEHCPQRSSLKKPVLIFLLLVFLPIAASAARYALIDDGRRSWQTADRSSVGLLPPERTHNEAMIRVSAAERSGGAGYSRCIVRSS